MKLKINYNYNYINIHYFKNHFDSTMTTAFTLTLFCCWLVNVNERPESNEPDEHLRVCELEIELILQFEDDEDDDDEDVEDVEDAVEFKFVVWLNVVLWLFVNELFIWIESELFAIDVPEIDEFKFNLNWNSSRQWMNDKLIHVH